MENKILIDSVNNLKVALNEISVYDFDVYTSMELYYKIAENFNKVIKELNRFEGVISDEVIKQNEKLLYLLGDGLKIEVVDKINEMVEKGVFDTIINHNIFNNLKNDINNVKSQLEHKASKDDIARISTGTPLFASSTAEMTDTTRTYVNTTDGYVYIYSVGSWTKTSILYQSTGIQDKSISEEKTTFIEVSPNLFDKDNCIQGKALVGGSGNNINSMTDANSLTWVSNIIEVEPNTQYIANSKNDATRFMVVSYKSDGNYDAGVTGVLTGENYVITTRANTKYIRFTFATTVLNMDTFMLVKGTTLPITYKGYYKKLDENLISDTIERIETLENVMIPLNPVLIEGNEISTFNHIVCCGDSLTKGVFNSSTNSFEDIKYSYPAFLTKLTGVTTENLGNPSYTTKQWYENRQGRDFSIYDCAIIQLGVNDVVQSVTDDETLEYLQKIIDKLHTDNPKMKIFIATITGSKWYDTEAYRTKSEVIRQFASNKESQNIFCVDLKKYSQIYDLPYASGHLTALGYMKQAEEYKNYISYIMKSNSEYFDDIQFIGTDYLPYN